MAFTLGIDFGTNSARALVVRCRDGAELGSCVAGYRSGRQGVLLDPGDAHLARQHPGDYLVALEESVRGALAAARRQPRILRQAGRRGSASTRPARAPFPVDRRNRPIALGRRWRRNLAAQCWLWKDHTSWREAARITEAAARMRPEYIAKCGESVLVGVVLVEDLALPLRWPPASSTPRIPGSSSPTGSPQSSPGSPTPLKVVRGICAAGHKALYSDEWGGLPDKRFLRALDPRLAALRDRLYQRAFDAGTAAGSLCAGVGRAGSGSPPASR